MTNSLVKNISHYGALLLTVGLTIWLEFILTMEWSSPYCMSQEDGPGYAAFGMPLPYMQFGGASSLQYEFMPHIYLLNLIVLSAIAFPTISWTFDRLSLTVSTRWRTVAGVVGLVLLAARISLLMLSISIKMLIPTLSIGDHYEPYVDFRPVGLCLHDGYYECKPSPYWFPDGWKYDQSK